MSELYPHQVLALRKLANGKILHGGVGSGKTRVAVEYYRMREAPKDVYVITTAKKRDDFDWQDEFYRALVGPKSGPVRVPGRQKPAGHMVGSLEQGGSNSSGDRDSPDPGRVVAGAGTGDRDSGGGDGRAGDDDQRRSTPVPVWALTVDSWNNINKYAGVEGAFFIFDEQRLVGSGQWTKAFLRISRRNTWILLSATPGDTWMDYVPVFIANGFYKNRTEFKHQHVVYNTFTKFPKVDRYINQGRLTRQRSQILVAMPYERHTRRRIVEVPLVYDKVMLDRVIKDRWHVYEERPLRDIAEMFLVMRRVVNSDPSRLEMVCELWKKHPKLIVFYNFNFELESLRSLKDYYQLFDPETGTPTKTENPGSGNTISMPTYIDGSSGVSSSFELSTSSGKKSRDSEAQATDSRDTRGVMARGNTRVETAPTSDSRGLAEWTKNSGLPRYYENKLVSSSSSKSSTNTTAGSSSSTRMSTGIEPSAIFEIRTSGSPAESATAITVPSSSEAPTSMSSPAPTTRQSVYKSAISKSDGSEQTPSLDGSTDHVTTSIAEWNGHKHEPVPTTDRWLYLVQYTAGAEGWNCVETDAMIMYSRNYSWKVTEQAYGRIDRLNTPFSDLWYYDFMTDSAVDKAIGRSLKAKGTFNEATFASMFAA